MKKCFLILCTVLLLVLSPRVSLHAQVLSVPQIIQEQTQWCWAASSKCVLDFFGHPNAQCTIADWARLNITWHNFGTVNCCTDASQGCNYWNYNYGYPGSIETILSNFGNITTNNMSNILTPAQIQTEVAAGMPFIFRWGWYSGGGHFMVGHGISGTDFYYMNSLVGYGYEIANYNWVVDDYSDHYWTHTQTLTVPAGINENNDVSNVSIYPNPSDGILTIQCRDIASDNYKIRVANALGMNVKEKEFSSMGNNFETFLDIQDLSSGLYLLTINSTTMNLVYKIQKL